MCKSRATPSSAYHVQPAVCHPTSSVCFVSVSQVVSVSVTASLGPLRGCVHEPHDRCRQHFRTLPCLSFLPQLLDDILQFFSLYLVNKAYLYQDFFKKEISDYRVLEQSFLACSSSYKPNLSSMLCQIAHCLSPHVICLFCFCLARTVCSSTTPPSSLRE